MSDKLKSLTNATTAVKHTVSLLGLAAAGVVSLTLLYTQVDATGKKADANETKIEAIKETLSGIDTQQKLIMQEIENEKAANWQFRGRTDRSLDRILDRLPVRANPGVRPDE